MTLSVMNNLTLRSSPDQVSPAAVYLASLAPSGRKSMASQLRSLANLLIGEPRPDLIDWLSVDRATLSAVVEHMRVAGKSPATINHAISAVKRVNQEAFHLGLVSVHHYQAVQSSPKFKGCRVIDEVYPSRQQVRSAVEYTLRDSRLMSLRDAALLATLAGAGLRKAEAIAVHTTDYVGGALRITGKGNKEAIQPVSPPARHLLEDYLGQVPPGPLFPSWSRYDQPRGTHLSPAGVDKIVDRHLPGVSPHKLRHAYASWLAEDGQPLAVIQRLMRHSNPNLTMRYIHNKEAQLTASEFLQF